MNHVPLTLVFAAALLSAGCAGSASSTGSESDPAQASDSGKASPNPNETETVGCEGGQQSAVDLDIPLEIVRPTPERAVLAYEDGFSVTLVEQQQRSAQVEAESADGQVVRVFDLNKTADGWSPSAYLECSY